MDRSMRPNRTSRFTRSTSRRRIVVATNIAETSVTVPRVTAVVDSGLHKVARYDAARGIDSLDIERIPADAADQRAGRAGRLSPGVVWRLWDARDRLRPHREPEIHRVDLCGTLLDVIAWGGDPRTFDWFERPRVETLEVALSLLARLGAIDAGRLTGHRRAGSSAADSPAARADADCGQRFARNGAGLRAALRASFHPRAIRIDDLGPAVRD